MRYGCTLCTLKSKPDSRIFSPLCDTLVVCGSVASINSRRRDLTSARRRRLGLPVYSRERVSSEIAAASTQLPRTGRNRRDARQYNNNASPCAGYQLYIIYKSLWQIIMATINLFPRAWDWRLIIWPGLGYQSNINNNKKKKPGK